MIPIMPSLLSRLYLAYCWFFCRFVHLQVDCNWRQLIRIPWEKYHTTSNVLKIGAIYEKVFDWDERAKHNGPTPYPNILGARKLDTDTLLNSLPSFPALSLTEDSFVAVAFTL